MDSFYKGEDVVVVGGGDSAAEESIYLSKLCNKVYLLVRKDFRCVHQKNNARKSIKNTKYRSFIQS